jgi:hypothetical protein
MQPCIPGPKSPVALRWVGVTSGASTGAGVIESDDDSETSGLIGLHLGRPEHGDHGKPLRMSVSDSIQLAELVTEGLDEGPGVGSSAGGAFDKGDGAVVLAVAVNVVAKPREQLGEVSPGE